MKNSNNIVIDRPLEKVFLWMFQPQHIVQLITIDPKDELIDLGPLPPDLNLSAHVVTTPPIDNPEYIEHTARTRRFLEQAETKIEIEQLSTPILQVGTTFQYQTALRSRSRENPNFPEFPDWKPIASGSIIIKKSLSPTFFSFTTRTLSASEHHLLTFHTQQEKTILTYEVTHFRKIEILFMIVSTVAPKLLPSRKDLITIGKTMMRGKLMLLKMQMEAEID